MRRRSVSRDRVGTRLFLVYSVASLVPVLALGLALWEGYRREALDRALTQGKAQAAVIEEMAIAPRLGPVDLSKPLGRRDRDRLLEATELSIFSGSVTHIHVRDFDGDVAFTDDGDFDDVLPASDPAFQAAAHGRTRAKLGRIPDGNERVVRVLQPIVPGADGRATGVLEVQIPYAPIAREVEAQRDAATKRMFAALASLYVVLALISWSSSHRLRRHAADREHRSLHDPLTGLPNREYFRHRAERALGNRGRGAIALVDLDRFKHVNDSLGHHAGDELLQEVARRLTDALRTDDVAARLGGDEFGLVLPGLSESDACELLERVGRDVGTPMVLDGITVDVEASFGVALYPGHGTDLDTLLKRADAAMYAGKRGTGRVVVSDGDEPMRDAGSVGVQSELRRAIGAGELELHYQPKVELATGRTHGVEALVRWRHPERGLLAPGAFLPAAEQSSLIEPLTAWVLERALADRAEWTAAGADWPVSVNVSARNLAAPGFADRVLGLLDATDTPPAELCIEITETAMAADADIATAALGRLGAAGVAVSIDDFGKGYTSLSQLRTLPVTEIKVDRTFVGGLPGGAQDRSIVSALVELGRGLGCAVTAEGVETAEVAAWLAAAGCDTAQGYHFARPAPWADLVARFTAPVAVPA